MNHIRLFQIVAKELRLEMAKQGKTIDGLAALLNVDFTTARRHYTGETSLSLNELESIAEWLGAPVALLTTGSRSIPPEGA